MVITTHVLVHPPHSLTCIGKGMHDGAGAWLKSAAARAVLSGVGIADFEEFFQFCIACLHTNSTAKNFTSQREFYLITSLLSAMYRGTIPASVTGSIKIKGIKTDPTGFGHNLNTVFALSVIHPN